MTQGPQFSLNAPVTGRIIAASSPVALCQHGLLGNGIVIDMTGSTLVAPADGVLEHVSCSGDYLSMRLNGSVSLQLIIGTGDAFDGHTALTPLQRESARVTEGTPLVSINQSTLRSLKPKQKQLTLLLCSHDTEHRLPSYHWQEPGLITAMRSPLIVQ